MPRRKSQRYCAALRSRAFPLSVNKVQSDPESQSSGRIGPYDPTHAPCSRRRGDRMKRREVIAGLAAAACPLSAGGQETKRSRRIGVLVGLSQDDPGMKLRLIALRQELEADEVI